MEVCFRTIFKKEVGATFKTLNSTNIATFLWEL